MKADDGKRIGRPPMGAVAMTNAERIAKWRAKHARRLKRKERYTPQPLTLEGLMDLVPGADEFVFGE